MGNEKLLVRATIVADITIKNKLQINMIWLLFLIIWNKKTIYILHYHTIRSEYISSGLCKAAKFNPFRNPFESLYK